MKFVFENELMKNALLKAQDIISNRQPTSILSNIKLMAYEGKLIIQAVSTALSMSVSFPVQVEEPGETTVYCDKFYGIVSTFQNGMIRFEKETDSIEAMIKPEDKRIRFKLKTMTTDKFPFTEELEAVDFNNLNAKDFKRCVRKVSFAVATDETRVFMSGVYLEKKDSNCNFVATDGRRLSFSEYKDVLGTGIPNVIVPVKFLDFVTKYGPNEGEIKLGVTSKKIFASFNDIEVSSLLIDGSFPAYQRVIPEKQEYSVTMPRRSLIDALKRCELMTDKKVGKILFEFTKNSLSLKGDNEIGSVLEEMEVPYEGKDMTIAMNYKYVQDALKSFDNDDVTLEFTGEMKAVTILDKGEKDFFHIIMPMQK